MNQKFFDISVPDEIYQVNRSLNDRDYVTFEDMFAIADLVIPSGKHRVLVMEDGCGSMWYEGDLREIDYSLPKEKNIEDTLKNLSDKGYLKILGSGEVKVEADDF